MSVDSHTEVNNEENLQKDLETAADDVFGTDVEIAKQAAEAAAEETPPVETPPKEETPPAEKTPPGEEAPPKEETPPGEEAPSKEELPPKEATPPAEEADPYDVPKDMKGRTRERFEKLTSNLKESHEKIEKQTGIIQGFRAVMESTGMAPAELQQTLELGGMIKKDPRRAYGALQKVVADLAQQLGEVTPGEDPLVGFEDLQKRVADRELTPEDAKDLAALRIKRKADEAQSERLRQEQTKENTAQVQQREFVTRVQGAQTTVAAFLKKAEADPDFERIGPNLVQAAEFAANNLEPEKWLGYISNEFTKVKEIAAAMAPSSPGGTPILDGGAPPGGLKEPRTLEELADNML